MPCPLQVLKLELEPEFLLKMGAQQTPDNGANIWKLKADNLNSVFKQSQGEKLWRVLQILNQAKSTLCTPFSHLRKGRVLAAWMEVNDKVKFLRTLASWFVKLIDTNQDFITLHKLFQPLIHITLLVWKNANVPVRLAVLSREMCNAMILQSTTYTNGEHFFELIEVEQAHVAVEQLKNVVKLCSQLKSTYVTSSCVASS